MKVLMAGGGTGGHLMPALALAQAFTEVRPDVEAVFVGAERGIEAQILPARNIHRFHLLPVEPLHRSAWWRNARWLWNVRGVMRRCHAILDQERPAFAVGTGGYAAGPVLLACRRQGIPIGLQEQNALPGLTTRILARKAAQVHLAFPEARARLRAGSSTRVFTFGNPISPPPPDRPGRAEARRALGVAEGGPVCFVMGGSQGARPINRALADALSEDRLDGVTILWGTGDAMWEEFRHHHDPARCLVKPFWDPVSDGYAAADVVVGRAGAMTIAEVSAWGLPSILIPLPSAARDHQTANALALERGGSAIHLPEAVLTGAGLAVQLRDLLEAPERLSTMAAKANERSHPEAARLIAEQLLTLAD